jgi:hypothetical protein
MFLLHQESENVMGAPQFSSHRAGEVNDLREKVFLYTAMGQIFLFHTTAKQAAILGFLFVCFV